MKDILAPNHTPAQVSQKEDLKGERHLCHTQDPSGRTDRFFFIISILFFCGSAPLQSFTRSIYFDVFFQFCLLANSPHHFFFAGERAAEFGCQDDNNRVCVDEFKPRQFFSVVASSFAPSSYDQQSVSRNSRARPHAHTHSLTYTKIYTQTTDRQTTNRQQLTKLVIFILNVILDINAILLHHQHSRICIQ